MIAARLEIKTDAKTGKPYLSGKTSYELPRGSWLILRKGDDGETYNLVAVTDGRKINTDPRNLLSFLFDQELADSFKLENQPTR